MGVKDKRLTLDLCGGGALNVPYHEFSNLGIEVDREAIVEVHGAGETRSSRPTPWLTTLERICPIDESEVVVDRLELDQQPFVADPPLRFTVKFNAKEGFYEVNGDFDVHFAEHSRAEVENRVLDEIAFSWQDIAQEPDDSDLSPRPAEVRLELLARIQKDEKHG